MHKKIVIIMMITAVLVSLTACRASQEVVEAEPYEVEQTESSTVEQAEPEEASQGLNIVATIFPAYDFTRAVAGAEGLTMLLPPGGSVHAFEPSPADIRAIGDADVFVYIGGESESWVERILSAVDVSDKLMIRLMDYVEILDEEFVEGMELGDHDHDHDHDHDQEPHRDEHIWTSPPNAIKLVNGIAEALSATYPERAEEYLRNAERYVAEINEIDREIREVVEASPRNKIVVADKFPFRYFVDEYGLEYRAAFSGCNDQTDASVATIAYLVNTVRDEGIEYIYYVELSTQNVARAVGEQTGADLLLLHSGHNVSRTEFESGITYVSLMRQNVENLRKGLN